MLRIKIQRTTDAETWILYGRLTGEMVDELKRTWKSARGERNGGKCVIDLVEVTLVDESGEQVLMEMMLDGAQFVGRGVYTTTLLETLSARCMKGA